MNAFFNNLPNEEQQRIKYLEPFDEYEEWHLKCSHYIILCALQGFCSNIFKKFAPFAERTVCNYPVCGEVELNIIDTPDDTAGLYR